MHVVARSPAFQPPYPIDRIKSLAGDVIVFGVLALIILSTTTLSTLGLPPPSPHHNSRPPPPPPPFELCLASRSSLSIA